MKVSKRNVFIVALSVAVCAAVYVNWRISSPVKPANADDVSSQLIDDKVLGQAELVNGNGIDGNDYFTQARIDRQKSREESAEVLKKIFDDSASTEKEKAEAQAGLLAIASNIEKEASVETLVKAKNFKECLAVINDSGISVIVMTNGLKENEPAMIKDIAVNETKLSADKVKIIEIAEN